VPVSRQAPVLLRVVREPLPNYGSPTISNPKTAYRFLLPILGPEPSEVMLALLLTVKHQVLGIAEVGRGGLDAVPCEPREVFRAAILANAACIVLAHNHPSGDPEPSREDIMVTERLLQAGEILGIPILDHVIVGERGFVSLTERGIIPGSGRQAPWS
jgi:DNA repair protein RadC